MKQLPCLLVACLLAAQNLFAQQTVGLFTYGAGNQDGYVLFAPIPSKTTYLIDKCGREVHRWTSNYRPGLSVYLQPDGQLLRTGSVGNPIFHAGGTGGVLEQMDWNGNITWSYTISDTGQCQHHDVCPMPNGNILVVVWEKKSVAEALAAGRKPSSLDTALWSEKILELRPSGNGSATVVWEWHVWDHLVQDFDAAKPNYGVVSQHPELIHLNFTGGAGSDADWLHINSVAYNAALDQVILTCHNFSELWVIDHSTTSAQAASHTGGRQNSGGDLLYRWGNPATYNRGTPADKMLFLPHHAHWIDSGFADGGKILIFNNGSNRPGGNYSSVDIIAPPVTTTGGYTITGNQPFAPVVPSWTYQAPVRSDFYAAIISGAQRLRNGKTLICDGPKGRFFEVDTLGQIAWDYVNPVSNTVLSQGSTAANNSAFRSMLYEPGYAGFTGRQLVPGNPIELQPLPLLCKPAAVSEATRSTPIYWSNPFGEALVFRTTAPIPSAVLYLTGLTGQIVDEWQLSGLTAGTTVQLPLRHSPPAGLYLARIVTSTGTLTTKLLHQP